MMKLNIVETRSTEGILVVRLLDQAAAHQHFAIQAKVYLPERKQTALLTPGGYYVFSDLPAGNYEIEVTAAEHYLPAVRSNVIVTPPPAGRNPNVVRPGVKAVDIVLKPSATYPFAPGTTVLRGQARNGQGNPVAGAEVRVEHFLTPPQVVGTLKTINGRKLFMDRLLSPLQAGDRLTLRAAGQTLNIQITVPLPQHYKQQPFYLTEKPDSQAENWEGALTTLIGSSMKTFTDDNGEWAMAFPYVRNFPLQITLMKMELSITHNGIALIEGQTHFIASTMR